MTKTEQALEALQDLRTAEENFLLAFGWVPVSDDAWHAPHGYSDKRPADYEYTTGHAVNGQKLVIYSRGNVAATVERLVGK